MVKIVRNPFPAEGLAVNNLTDELVEYEKLDEEFIQIKPAYLAPNLTACWIKWRLSMFQKTFFVFPDVEEID